MEVIPFGLGLGLSALALLLVVPEWLEATPPWFILAALYPVAMLTGHFGRRVTRRMRERGIEHARREPALRLDD